jgi:hypothetical protein
MLSPLLLMWEAWSKQEVFASVREWQFAVYKYTTGSTEVIKIFRSQNGSFYEYSTVGVTNSLRPLKPPPSVHAGFPL